jgi:hypothetical protein
MTSNDLDEAIAQLPIIASDPTRADRTRRRCRALLRRQQRRWDHVVSRIDIARRGLAPVFVGAFCVFFIVYVTALVATTLGLQGLLHARPTP